MRIALAIGVIGLLGSLIGGIVQPSVFASAWLAAMSLWVGWPLGCMALLLIHSMTGGNWGEAIRPQLLAGLRTLVLLPLVVLPFIFMLRHLYPWLQPDVAANLNNRFYLNLPFFIGRGCVYLAIWLGLAALILRRSARGWPLGALAPAGLLLLAFSVTFAAIDTTMSLDPHYNSSVYGMLIGTSDTLLALSLSLLLAALAGGARGEWNDLGRLLLGLAVLWAYLDFVQLLIVWQSNLTEDAPWYVPRLSGVWGALAIVVAVVHFVLPFFLLLSPTLRRSPRGIAGVCSLLVVGEILRAWWLVLPAFTTGPGWQSVATVLGIAGIAAAIALRRVAPPPALSEETAHV
jgi:hypothetical protein